jgi:tetratricopeptide (TPR) repeat protein
MQKQLCISGALHAYETKPTPETAVELHETMVTFLQTGQAATFRPEMLERFGNNAKVHAYLGHVLQQLGRQVDSTKHFARALELRPDLPEARVGVAQQYLRELKFDEARATLDFLEKPGAEHLYSLSPLEELVNAYRGARKFRPALEIYQRLLAALPHIGQIPSFRDCVRNCEAALQEKTTILPKREWQEEAGRGMPWRTLATVGFIILLVSAGFVIANEYIRRHRTLYLVNATSADVTVAVHSSSLDRTVHLPATKAPLPQARPSLQKITLPEGSYHISEAGGSGVGFDMEVRTSYWSRWSGDPIWLINVQGAALLVETTATYRDDSPRPIQTLHFGREHEVLEAVSNPFTELPESIRMKSNESRTLTQLDFARTEPYAWMQKLSMDRRWSEAMDLAEWTLRRSPSEEVLAEYMEIATNRKESNRAERFLRTGLAHRPVSITWHRAYQNFHRKAAEEPALIAEYDALLNADPENADLLYLRGRLDSPGRAWFERALKIDPLHPYASFALGFNNLASADFAAARPLLARGVEGIPGSGQFAEALWACRQALGEMGAMEKETRESLKGATVDMRATIHLIDLLALQGRNAEAREIVSDFERKTARMVRQDAELVVAIVRRHALYAAGDFIGLEKDVSPGLPAELNSVNTESLLSAGVGFPDPADRRSSPSLLGGKRQREFEDALKQVLEKKRQGDVSPAGQAALYQALFEQGRLSEATKLRPLSAMTSEDALSCLIVSLAWQKKGDEPTAAVWFRRGVELLAVDGGDSAAMARMLRQDSALDMPAVRALSADPTTKAIFLAVLAALHPEQREELHRLARVMPMSPAFPYHFIQRTIGAEK